MDDPTYPGAVQQALRGHAIFRFIALLLAFGFQILVVKILSPESYATYAVLLATLMVGERLLSFGTDRTILRFVPALIVRQDRDGLRSLAVRLGLLRATGIILFVLALTSSTALQQITPSQISTTTTSAFGVWFVAYTVFKEADAVAQSLVVHHWAALVAACEGFMRLGSLSLMHLLSRSVDVETVVVLYAITSSVAAAGLPCGIWRSAGRRRLPPPSALSSPNAAGFAVHRQVALFATAAYASTLSYLISSPGVIRLVARTGLGIHALAAFSFVQGLSMSVSNALPGQLILPGLESIAAKMTDSGSGEKIFPALSVLFKSELTCVLAIIVATVTAGAEVITTLSRAEYAPYYFVLPILMVGLVLQTVYRVLEILGSANLKYKIFLTVWPLSLGAVAALYVTVGRWGLISVVVVPIVEIAARVAILTVGLRRYGVAKALDPTGSFRLVLSAALVVLCSFGLLAAVGQSLASTRLLVAVGGVMVFLLSLLIVRPLSALECETLSKVLPESWSLPKYIARRLSRP